MGITLRRRTKTSTMLINEQPRLHDAFYQDAHAYMLVENPTFHVYHVVDLSNRNEACRGNFPVIMQPREASRTSTSVEGAAWSLLSPIHCFAMKRETTDDVAVVATIFPTQPKS